MDTASEIPAVIRDLMAEDGITQRRLAERALIPIVSLNRYLHGGSDLHLTKFSRICTALGREVPDVWAMAEARAAA